MVKKRRLSQDILNRKYDWFFRGERGLSQIEYMLHDLGPTLNTVLWVQWAEPKEDGGGDGLAVSGGDVKHLSFPNFNIPFPFKKRL